MTSMKNLGPPILWIIVFLDSCYMPALGTRWLALAKLGAVATISTKDTCENLNGLSRRQVKICKRNIEVMNSVKRGAQSAIKECQWQFMRRRWNCSVVNSTHVFGNVLKLGSREAAFVHAISAAGVAHSVTKACSGGQLTKCGCDRSISGTIRDDFQWFGCSENIAYGNAFSKSFVEAIERRDRVTRKKIPFSRVLMNTHNNEAGRKVLEDEMRIECKCHGVSGSCELKTCWKSLPPFRMVGSILKEKFDGATEVKQVKQGRRRYLIPVIKEYKPHTASDLVYLEASPSFCDNDEIAGTPGTRGRRCNATSAAMDGCDLMCCRRGFQTRVERAVERCKCKFHWCCYVTCESCVRTVKVHTCL